jgi:hypothetical protein
VTDIFKGARKGRLLVYFPIIHMQADLGALGELVQRIKIRRLAGAPGAATFI